MVIKANTQERPIEAALADMLWMEFYTRKGWGWLPVRGGSMRPLMQAGDQVLISRVMAERINRGDIIVFRRGGSMIVHRVLKKLCTDKGIFFIEKGDNSPRRRIFSADKVIGRVAMVKGSEKLFSLDSPFSRLTSQALSVLFYYTAIIVNKFRSATNEKVGWVLYLMSSFISKGLVRVCSVVWYVAGLHMRNKRILVGNVR